MSKRRRTKPQGSAAAAKSRREDKPQRTKWRDVYVPRPFDGLADEPEWIALRELVPAASAPLRLAEPYASQVGDRPVILATVLPMAWPAMTRADGTVLVGLQRQFQSGDVSRDVAAALLQALATTPGDTVSVPALPGPGPRLQDVLASDSLAITVHDSFEFWLGEDAGDDPNVRASLERANESIYPTKRLTATALGAPYWCQVPDRAHVRWVLPQDEDSALTALARLAASGGLTLGESTKFAGMFRAHGVLVPVWDLPHNQPADAWEEPLAGVAKRYADALTVDTPLTGEERRSRQGLVGRQLTLR